MGKIESGRLWIFGGLVVIIVAVAASWFFAISPKLQEADDTQSQADDATIKIVALKKEIAGLKQQAKLQASYQAQRDKSRAALPENWDQPAFLRQLQASGTAVDVAVSGMTVGSPVSSKTVPTAVELPITLSAEGTPAALSNFLIRLQNVQPRAVLITSANLAIEDDSTTLGLALTAFVSPKN
jgi:Tfp pilus assembly protein PilO